MIHFDSVSFDDDFFRRLKKNETLLANIETLILHRIEYETNIAVVMAKMTNIINLDLNCNIFINEWVDILRKLPIASRIKSLTLENRDEIHKHPASMSNTADSNVVYTFNNLQRLHVKSGDAPELKQAFESIFTSNIISNIQQITVDCSANAFVTDVLAIGINDESKTSQSTQFSLPNLTYIKCNGIRDTLSRTDKDNMIQVMKNITNWLDLLSASKCHNKNVIKSFNIESEKSNSNNYDRRGEDGGIHKIFKPQNERSESAQKSRFATRFLKQLIKLNKNDNVDCTWYGRKEGKEDKDLGIVVERMKQLKIISANDVKQYTITSSFDGPDRTFDCYSLFNQRICFEQDCYGVRIITKSKYM